MKITATLDVKRGQRDAHVAMTLEHGVVELYLSPVERQSSATFAVDIAELENAISALKKAEAIGKPVFRQLELSEEEKAVLSNGR